MQNEHADEDEDHMAAPAADDAPSAHHGSATTARGRVTRRGLLAAAAASAGGVVLARLPAQAPARRAAPATAPPTQPAAPPGAPVYDLASVPADPTRAPGPPTSALGARSPFEVPARTPVGVVTGSSLTPLHQLTGTVTPSDLVFERHHAGVALIDPARYQLMIHGLVDRPTVFSLDDLHRLPSVSRTVFLECSGNGRGAYRTPKREMTAQAVDGLTSSGEWTGVPLATLFREVGLLRGASWFRAEGGDAARLSRSVPLEKGMDDALIAYAFNGEPLRPSNGYPARLLLPGYEGNANIKWVRRIEVSDGPGMFRDETAKYTDPLANGTARQFSFVLDAKSIITAPTYPSRVTANAWTQITGLAWSGRGKIVRVDVSVDGGKSWIVAELQEPVQAMAHTRFRMPWQWNGQPAVLMSRAVDETGYTQPTVAEFRGKRGAGTDYHFNYIRGWAVDSDGQVFYGVDA
jgi:sulfane dehydrogenase subunit SoxC